ncbi:MAG: sortase [Eubacteriales bacterium]|nr:sortase [Eubacteriales bacterium]
MSSKKKNGRNQTGLLSITIGLLLIAAALFLTARNLYDELRAEQSARQVISHLEDLTAGTAQEASTNPSVDPEPTVGEGQIAVPDYVLCPDMEMPVETINGIDYIGVLQIPALELELPIISQWSYPNLKTAPCRYSGSAYLNDLIICAHNYASHFGNLKNLREGDLATFTDMDGNVFTYRLVEQEILLPAAVEEMESGDWDLTLFTCTVGGQSRVTVRFEIVTDN